jgi:tRNA (Thr-GGU) A37 N-methylase
LIKNLTNFDGIELHPNFLQTLMDFDGNQPIRILFWNDEMMFTKQKHMVIKRRERENQQDE